MKNTAISENHLYGKVYRGGEKAVGKYTVIYILKDKKAARLKRAHPQKKAVNRIGLTVTKKLGSAVVRNRVKRIIRAALQETEKNYCLKKGYLVVIAARDAAKYAKSSELAAEMPGLFDKLGMILRCNPGCGCDVSVASKEDSVAVKAEIACDKENGVSVREETACDKENGVAVREETACDKENGVAVREETACDKENGVSVREETVCDTENGVPVGEKTAFCKENSVPVGEEAACDKDFSDAEKR